MKKIREVCYLGNDEQMAEVLRRLFEARGLTLCWLAELLPEAGWLQQSDLIIIDQWVPDWENMIRTFAAAGKTVWAITNVPENLGAEDAMARRVHQLGAVTYLARVYNTDALTEAFEFALQISSGEKVFA